ncbi:MAG: hypothetical protein Ct9H300mP29_4550 [Candidatus Neomarinimicrobiota bacterium]|nr:MAG: hypothetical protein Ct9H300mP29_4550 [Candidatus Neomarinimicrobiota bacterium]
MEVIELTCPADHETCVDHEIKLPTSLVDPERLYKDRILFDMKRQSRMEPGGWKVLRLGILVLLLPQMAWLEYGSPILLGKPQPEFVSHDADLLFMFLLNGSLSSIAIKWLQNYLPLGLVYYPGALKQVFRMLKRYGGIGGGASS